MKTTSEPKSQDKLPKFKKRRLFEDDKPDGYLESDKDFVDNNFDAAVWLLENAHRLQIKKKAKTT